MRRAVSLRMRPDLPSGHTLWEMLFALALLGVITAIVTPAISIARAGARESDVVGTTRDLVDALTRTRLIALERGTPMELVLEPATGRVWVLSRAADDQRVSATGQLELPLGASLLADSARVRFSFGAAGTASGGAVVIRGAAGERRVTVDPWTGVPDVQSR